MKIKMREIINPRRFVAVCVPIDADMIIRSYFTCFGMQGQ